MPSSAPHLWTAEGADRATEYTYRIFAVNVAGDSDWTSASAITLANAPPEAPSVPIAVGVEGEGSGVGWIAGPGSVELDWDSAGLQWRRGNFQLPSAP